MPKYYVTAEAKNVFGKPVYMGHYGLLSADNLDDARDKAVKFVQSECDVRNYHFYRVEVTERQPWWKFW